MVDIVIQKFANREVRFGVQQFLRRAKGYGDKAQEKHRDDESFLFALSQSSVVSSANMVYQVSGDKTMCALLGKPEPEQMFGSDGMREPVAHTAQKRIDRALDITHEFQRARKEARSRKNDYKCDNRPTVFTRGARHRILEAGAVAERWGAGKAGIGYFITLTLPGSTADAVRTLARWSGYVCNRLTQFIRRASTESIWFYTWEWQKRGALHLHLYLRSKDSESGVSIAIDCVKAWYKALEDISRKSGVDLFVSGKSGKRVADTSWQFDVRPVTYGSAAAYVSKYVGKSANCQNRKGFNPKQVESWYPARWWGMSRNLKRLTDEHRTDVCISGITLEQASIILESFTGELLRVGAIKSYSYEFEVFAGRGTDRLRIGNGIRWIQFYGDNEFSEIGVWLRQWFRYVLKMFPNASMQYKYGNPIASMQRGNMLTAA